MLRYKSSLLQTLSTLFFSPFLLLGSAEEKQLLSVELCEYYEEDAVSSYYVNNVMSMKIVIFVEFLNTQVIISTLAKYPGVEVHPVSV